MGTALVLIFMLAWGGGCAIAIGMLWLMQREEASREQ